jgi:glucose/arabinose dehydrogenase
MRNLAVALAGAFVLTSCAGSSPTAQSSPSALTASPTPTQSSPSPTATPTPLATPTSASADNRAFKFTKVAGGLQSPVYVTGAGDGSGRLFIVEQVGLIRVIKDGRLLPTPFLDIRSLVVSGGERGLLSVAFHPQFKTNGTFVVDYTRTSTNPAAVGDTVIARFKANPPTADVADRASGQTLLTVHQPQANHNGGLVNFGPDGFLYIGMGDGGAGGDTGPGHAPEGNGQSLTTLLGKILRIEVNDTGQYRIPSSNPNLGAGTRREIWAYGVRNPWRFSFDRATGDLYIGDVGQNAWEEVDFQPAAAKGGANYGWPSWEGDHRYRFSPARANDTKPIAEYHHEAGVCAVTGGYVYRGTKIQALSGFYIFGDYCTGQLWTLVKYRGSWRRSVLRDTPYLISSFGEDDTGELYVVDHAGSVYRFDPA